LTTAGNVTVTGQLSDTGSGVASLQAQVDAGSPSNVTITSGGTLTFTTALALDGSANGPHTGHLRATDQVGNVSTPVDVSFTLDPNNAAAVAPPIDMTVPTTLAAATQFLYTGSNPIQQGVAPGTIVAVRAAVLRGNVQQRDGTPLPRVTITVLNHPEFGSTQTDMEGNFNLAVNGGGLLTVNYARDGFLPDQRQVQAP
jgi:hypothetical protein